MMGCYRLSWKLIWDKGKKTWYVPFVGTIGRVRGKAILPPLCTHTNNKTYKIQYLCCWLAYIHISTCYYVYSNRPKSDLTLYTSDVKFALLDNVDLTMGRSARNRRFRALFFRLVDFIRIGGRIGNYLFRYTPVTKCFTLLINPYIYMSIILKLLAYAIVRAYISWSYLIDTWPMIIGQW